MISVIIPAYNYAQYLPYAVHSALMQEEDGMRVEVIIVDDGSTDATPEAARSFGDAVRYIQQDNQGLSAARNTGMRAARGDSLVFMDADDMIAPGTLAVQRRTLERSNADIAVCPNESGYGLGPAGPFWSAGMWRLMREHIPVHLCLHNVAPVHAYMVRTAMARRVGEFDITLKACEDHDFWLRCAAAGARFAANGEGLAFYRKHAASMSSQTARQLFHDVVLHQRVRHLLDGYPEFVGSMLPEAWMAHAAGCLRTLIALLELPALPECERRAKQTMWLVENAAQAVRAAAQALTRMRLIGRSVGEDAGLLGFYVLGVLAPIEQLHLPSLPSLSHARTLLNKLFPQWNLPRNQNETLRGKIMKTLIVPQRPADFDALLKPVLIARPVGIEEPLRPRILLCTDFFYPSTGGCEVFMEALGQRLLRAGYDVHVATRHMDERASLSREGMHIIPFRCEGRFQDNYFGKEYDLYKTFSRSISWHARIILCQPDSWLTAPLLQTPLPGSTILMPVINKEEVESWRQSNTLPLVAQVLLRADICLSLTQSGLDRHFMESLGITPAFLPHAITEYEPRPGFRARNGLEPHKPLLVHVGNFWPVKNHLRLMETLRKEEGDWQVAFIGHALPWPREREYHAQARLLAALDPRMRMLGGLPPEEADAAIAEADLLLLSSHAECRPLVILQAMRHGTPWIATPECNSVHDDAGGLIVPVERFGEAARACLANPALRNALGITGKEHWRQRFSWEVVMPLFQDIIENRAIVADMRMPSGIREANANIQRKILEL